MKGCCPACAGDRKESCDIEDCGGPKVRETVHFLMNMLNK